MDENNSISGRTGKRGETGNVVHILQDHFDPRVMQIIAGTTITWVNNDEIAHSVTADDESFDSWNIQPGASFSKVITQVGTLNYHCKYHPEMVGQLNVTGVK